MKPSAAAPSMAWPSRLVNFVGRTAGRTGKAMIPSLSEALPSVSLTKNSTEDEEPLEPDELPEHMRPAPKIDMSKMDTSNPENILKASKKGRMLMTFITLLGKPTREETEEITSIWQTSLMNNHISVDRYILDDNRALFTFKDGSQAWEAKDFLVQQDQLETITIENKPYYGKNAGDKEIQDMLDLINEKFGKK
ncbi:hypothetical protein HPB51_027321 [Rhipicephalus microplus]|uniref:Uncharacterized protein n=1 Tax=Rhipicephalus microplus TaxID=6941 RepID=A0A9J6D0G7_RHIMP|nr:hypothetical protein HPB51_027321 [Rhipicephalus microplus]